jgi:uncharacterized protein
VTTSLLDANVLIALTVVEHEHHVRAATWAAGIDRFALCPVVEGALVRFLVRVGESAAVATQLLRAVHAVPGCEFWPDAVSYRDADLGHVRGHRQRHRRLPGEPGRRPGGAQLATLDEGLRQERPDVTVLVPTL